MSSQFAQNTVRVNKDILTELLNYKTFTFNEIHEKYPEYTIKIHRKFISTGILQKVSSIKHRDIWTFRISGEVRDRLQNGPFKRD